MTKYYFFKGEIPDVQIKNKDLLMPLEILATADYNISRLLYSSLVVSIVNEMKESVRNISAWQLQFGRLICVHLGCRRRVCYIQAKDGSVNL